MQYRQPTAASVYANEWDKHAAHWLSCLPLQFDEIDTRSIQFVQGREIEHFTQCHFFAGIGGWPLALEIAGWPIDAPVWTGSCPCQPFSQAGKRKGTADERHLWPEFRRLIDECRPTTIFGEQVASKAGRDWLATVRTDLEALGYAVGAADLCAASVGAPHIRQRLFWVAHCASYNERRLWQPGERNGPIERSPGRHRSDGGLANGSSERLEERQEQPARQECETAERSGYVIGMADTRRERSDSRRRYDNRMETQERSQQILDDQSNCGLGDTNGSRSISRSEATKATRYGCAAFAANWSDVEYIECRDGKARPVKPGVRLLVNGVSGRVAVCRSTQQGSATVQETHEYARVGALKGLGNAIVPQVAAEFIRAFMETQHAL